MRSIRRKITLSSLALATIALSITGVLLLITTRYIAQQLQAESLQETATVVVPGIRQILQSEADEERISEYIAMAEALGNVELRFVGQDGEPLSSTLMAERFRRDPAAVFNMRMPGMDSPAARMWQRATGETPFNPPNGRMMPAPGAVIRLPVGTGTEAGYLEISDQGNLTGRLTRLTGIGFLISAALTLGASALISVLLSRGLTRPLENLTGTVQAMADGNLDARAEAGSRDEIGVLAVQFNVMADRLLASISELRSFLADASHELRTPLTAVGTFTELLQDKVTGPEELELLEDISEQLARMGCTVSDLLLISRLDGGVTPIATEPCALEPVIREAWATVRAARPHPEVNLLLRESASGPAGVTIAAERNRLLTVFENVLDNSVRSFPTRGTVECLIEDDGETCTVSIVDNGTGIAPEHLPHVFRRFHRAREEAPGSGLGLAIAQAIVHAHGGEINALSPAFGRDGGTEIRITLPTA